MADISKLLGAGGGGGGGMMAAMGRMGGLGGMGGMAGPMMAGMMGGGGGGMMGKAPAAPAGPDPRLQNLTPEEFFKPGGELAYRFGGMNALNPSQQYRAEQRLNMPAPAAPNFAAMAPYFTAAQGGMQGQQPGQPSPLRGMFRR